MLLKQALPCPVSIVDVPLDCPPGNWSSYRLIGAGHKHSGWLSFKVPNCADHVAMAHLHAVTLQTPSTGLTYISMRPCVPSRMPCCPGALAWLACSRQPIRRGRTVWVFPVPRTCYCPYPAGLMPFAAARALHTEAASSSTAAGTLVDDDGPALETGKSC
jgi:hypothetical protein